MHVQVLLNIRHRTAYQLLTVAMRQGLPGKQGALLAAAAGAVRWAAEVEALLQLHRATQPHLRQNGQNEAAGVVWLPTSTGQGLASTILELTSKQAPTCPARLWRSAKTTLLRQQPLTSM